MLWLNFLRALKGTLPRLVSVILITAIAVTVYAALGGITYNVRRICDQYYTEQNVADYWITGTNLDRAAPSWPCPASPACSPGCPWRSRKRATAPSPWLSTPCRTPMR